MDSLEKRIKEPQARCGAKLGKDGEVVHNAVPTTALVWQRAKKRLKPPNKPPS